MNIQDSEHKKRLQMAKDYAENMSRKDHNITSIYTVGSLVRNEPIYDWSDVDLRVVMSGENPGKQVEYIDIKGIIFEIAYRGSDQFSDMSSVLSNIRLYDIAFSTVLYDKNGDLSNFQKKILHHYDSPQWSIKRATHILQDSNKIWGPRIERAISEKNYDYLGNLLLIWLSNLIQVIVCLTNRSPSLRGLLHRFEDAAYDVGHPELFTKGLALHGGSDTSYSEIDQWLHKAEQWYSKAINHPDARWSKSDLHPLMKRYWVEGTMHLFQQTQNYKYAILPITVILFQLRPVLTDDKHDYEEQIWKEYKHWLGFGLETVMEKYDLIKDFSKDITDILENIK